MFSFPEFVKNKAKRKQLEIEQTVEGVCQFSEMPNHQPVQHGILKNDLNWDCELNNQCPKFFVNRNFSLEWKCVGNEYFLRFVPT